MFFRTSQGKYIGLSQGKNTIFNAKAREVIHKNSVATLIKLKEKACNICFIICHQHQTRPGKIKAKKPSKFQLKRKFFCKNWTTTYLTTTPSKSFYIMFVNIFFLKSLTHEKFNIIRIFLTWNWQFVRAWREIKLENILHFYDVTIIDVTVVQ